MNEYHKIQTVFKRDPATKYKTLLMGDYSLPEFEYLANNQWVFTEKVDGTNIRIKFDSKLTFGGKTERAQIPAKLVQRLEESFFPMIDRFRALFDGEVCLYGEGYGAGIQKGGVYRQDQDFVLFDVKIGNWWLQRNAVEDIADKLDLDVVPIIREGTLTEMIALTQAGVESTWGEFVMEGFVARPKTELKARNGDRIITKIKYKDFQ